MLFYYVKRNILQLCCSYLRNPISCFPLLYLIHHSIRQIDVLIFAPLIHHDRAVSADSQGDRQSTAESWTLVHACFLTTDIHWTPTHGMYTLILTHSHSDFPSVALSCYPSMNIKVIKQWTSICTCCKQKQRKCELTQIMSCGCIALWSIEAAVGGKKNISLYFSLHDFWWCLRTTLQWNNSSCALNIIQ